MQLTFPFSFSVYINGLALFCTSVQTVLFGHWILLLFQIRISCTVQYLVYENSLTAHWQSICKVKLVLLQEVKEPVLRRIGGARGVGGANLKKKFLFLLFAVIQRKSRTCVKYSGEKTFMGNRTLNSAELQSNFSDIWTRTCKKQK